MIGVRKLDVAMRGYPLATRSPTESDRAFYINSFDDEIKELWVTNWTAASDLNSPSSLSEERV